MRTLHPSWLPSICSLFALAALSSAHAVSDYTTPYAITTLAGTSSIGSNAGIGSAARFYRPQGIAGDLAGNLYVADSDNNTVRKISPASVVTTLAGSAGYRGSTDGLGSAARFNFPSSLVVDRAGILYVADANNHAIRKITPDGMVTTFAGALGISGSNDGTGTEARFNRPEGIALDAFGSFYIADAGNHIIRKITSDRSVMTLAGKAGFAGTVNGSGSAARFGTPFRIAIDAGGNLYVSELENRDIRKITPDGNVTTFYGPIYSSFNGYLYIVSAPGGIAVDTGGRVVFIDRDSDTLSILNQDGSVATRINGSPGSTSERLEEIDNPAKFSRAEGLAKDPLGHLLLADTGNNRISRISSTNYVATIAGLSPQGCAGNTDGPGRTSRFSHLREITLDATGNAYVIDSQYIRKIAPSGLVSTLADTAQGSSLFFNPCGLAVDFTGNIFFALNQTIQKISPNGNLSTVAGSPRQFGFKDGHGSNARFSSPSDLTIDSHGNIFVADENNHVIRKIAPSGDVTTFAGQAGNYGDADGPREKARFNHPRKIAIDHADSVYVVDNWNRSLRKITPDGTVTTLMGWASSNKDSQPTIGNITTDASENLYISTNPTIYRLEPNGRVTLLAGLVAPLGDADSVGLQAGFDMANGMAADNAGTLYLTTTTSVYKGLLASLPVIAAQPRNLNVTLGSPVQFSATASGVPAPTYQWYHNGSPFSGATSGTLSFTNARTSDAGNYTVVVTNALGSVTSNAATLTVTTTSTPPPSNGGKGGSSDSGGGGGAPSAWFYSILLSLVLIRLRPGHHFRLNAE